MPSMNIMEELKRTALFEEHVRAGGRMVPFAGWEMPVQYAGVIAEVRAVREGCGVFDVSHMGQLDVAGPGVAEALNSVVSADWSRVPAGRVAYALLLDETGGVLDDVMGYHLAPDEWFLVVNASRAPVDEPHFRRHLEGLTICNRYENQAMLAIQGPRSPEIVQPLLDAADADVGMTASSDASTRLDLKAFGWRDCAPARLAGAPGLLARGGYTGSDGFEFMFAARDAPRVWSALLEAGAAPCGLGARDVLRLEAGLPLYGHELREEWTPFESGCGFAVALEKGDFVGRAALLERGEVRRRVRALKMQGRAIAREGYAVVREKGDKETEVIGEVTSGTLSPTVGVGIALAMLPAELQPGERVEVLVRDAPYPATVVQPPFVARRRQ